MRVVAVSVGLPREVTWKGKKVTTGIFKEPVAGPVRVRRLNLEGDCQADPSVHGGPDMAVYAYPAEHYVWWRAELPVMHLPWGMFGENLTIEGLLEGETGIGDRFRVGSALLVVRQPRMPCYKLGIKFGRPDIVKRFLHSGRTGFYFSVEEEGHVHAGDAVSLVDRDPGGITVADIARLYTDKKPNLDLLRRAAGAAALPDGWRTYFAARIEKLETRR
jgi:MOSC domain-containing protein YiiM